MSRYARSPSASLTDIEGVGGDPLYHLRRASIKSELRLRKILDHLHIDDVTKDVDNALVIPSPHRRSRVLPSTGEVCGGS